MVDEIEFMLEWQLMEEDKIIGGIMDFLEDEVVVYFSVSKCD